MSILTRDDGAQFVMQAYRELLTYKKKSTVSQRVREIAEQQGQFVRLFKKEAGQYEAVFSREPGYLLGESVKHYFNEAQNLIFCETLSNSTDILVVVIRSGSVYLDALIPMKNLRHELLPLLTQEQNYQVVISGNILLKENGLNFPPELVKTFETLDEPLLSRLPTLKVLQLLPLPLALKGERLTRQPLSSITFILLLLIAVSGAWLLFHKQQNTNLPTLQTTINPYEAYYKALATPSPDKLFTELENTIVKLYTLPGWTVKTIHFDGLQYWIAVSSEGGSLQSLNLWAKDHQFHYQLKPDTAALTFKSTLSARKKPDSVFPSQPIINLLIDQLDILLQGKHIALHERNRKGKVYETKMSIILKDAPPQLLVMIGQELKNLPVSITGANFTVSPGILNGTINLSVWGT